MDNYVSTRRRHAMRLSDFSRMERALNGGAYFRVRERAIIGAHGGAGWAPTGNVRRTVREVAELLGDDFAELVYRP